MVEERASEWQLHYCFYGDAEAGWVHVLVSAPLHETIFPSIVKFVHAADWHGFHLSVEKFAFQDLPIILSAFDLSVAENDR